MFKRLCEGLGKKTTIDLYEDYTEELLEKIKPTVENWTSVSCERFIFQLILEESGNKLFE